MRMPKGLKIKGGKNIAMKVPPHLFGDTVRFYREILGLKVLERYSPDVAFQFGEMVLWIDSVEKLSQAELWLEVNTNDISKASKHFEKCGVVRRDGIEQLPEDLKGFWISSPSMIIHLVCES